VLGNVISSGIKVMVLAVIVAIGSGFFADSVSALPAEPGMADAMTLVLGALALFGLGIFGPSIASGLVSGAPQLGAGAAVGTMAGAALATGGTALLGARAAMAAGSGGMAAIRAGTAMGSAASTAYQLGQATSGSSTVAAGLGGMANAAGWSAMQSARSAASRFVAPFRESVERGRQAAWNAGRPAPAAAPSAASAGGAATAPATQGAPAWAPRLRSEQAARHHRHLAMQTIKDGDRPGGAANPDLNQKD
jgi:type IV secretion system protein TrbL